jgi:hypothetical protein
VNASQGAEQWKVILAAKEDDVLPGIVQHAEILIGVRLSPALVRIGALSKGDIVIRCQEVGFDQSPTCR